MVVKEVEMKQSVNICALALVLEELLERIDLSLDDFEHGLDLLPQLLHAVHLPFGVRPKIFLQWVFLRLVRHRLDQLLELWVEDDLIGPLGVVCTSMNLIPG